MNAICFFEPEYNIQSFRDLPQIRTRTFKEGMIQYVFRDTSIQLVSLKAIQKKLKEYKKKKKKDIGLEYLEFRLELEAEEETEPS